MSMDRETENAAAKIFQPINELLAREADELRRAAERIEDEKRKLQILFPPARRADEA